MVQDKLENKPYRYFFSINEPSTYYKTRIYYIISMHMCVHERARAFVHMHFSKVKTVVKYL